jgi:hypothetical protein
MVCIVVAIAFVYSIGTAVDNPCSAYLPPGQPLDSEGEPSGRVAENEVSGAARLTEIEERLRPRVQRAWALAELESMFSSGSAPARPLSGFLSGTILTSCIGGPADQVLSWIGDLYMPWLGKLFDANKGAGKNVLKRNARIPMALVWPSYEPVGESEEQIEAFPFETSEASSVIGSGAGVLRIDYDLAENPDLFVRRLLDEVVQLEDGLYLGRALYRLENEVKLLGYFSLARPDGP